MSQGNKSAPAREVLEHTLSLPCSYVLKVFGPAGPAFETRVMSAAEAVVSADRVRCEGRRFTRSGDRVALTVVANVETVDEVIALYEDIAACEGLITII